MMAGMMYTYRAPTNNSVTAALLLVALLAGCLADACYNPAKAVVFNIGNQATPEISIKVGGGGGTITRVNFTVPGAQVGDDTDVAGNRQINFRLIIRAPASNPLTGFLTVDSSTELSNGNGATIPVSEISWTARDGDIPSGNFTDAVDQPLVSFTSSVRVVDRHTFSYANRNIYDAGTYNGQVTYTWSAP